MVSAPAMEQMGPGEYEPNSGINWCNAPNYMGWYNLEGMSAPPTEPSMPSSPLREKNLLVPLQSNHMSLND